MTTMPPESTLSPIQARKLDAVMTAACAVLPRYYRPDCCIAAARVLVDVFAALHVRSRPLSVMIDVFNPAMVARAEANGGRLPETSEEYQAWVEQMGAWWITLGAPDSPPEPGRWPGHLAVLAWESVLLDVTITQADRPHRGIRLAPLAIQVGPEDLDGTSRRVVECNGCELHYLARPGDRSYMAAQDWWDRRRCEAAVRAILRRVRDELKA